MEIPSKESFQHNGKIFEIITTADNNNFKVYVAHNNEQVSPVYIVDITTNSEYFAQYKSDLIGHLKSVAKSDIEQEMYFKG